MTQQKRGVPEFEFCTHRAKLRRVGKAKVAMCTCCWTRVKKRFRRKRMQSMQVGLFKNAGKKTGLGNPRIVTSCAAASAAH